MASQYSTGTYILILQSQQTAQLQVGKPGLLNLRPGYYLYVGSAFGPGGIPARTAHHKKIQTRSHWHIDYLRRQTDLPAIWYSIDRVKREHRWAQVLAGEKTCNVAMPRFGASDCQCPSHLFYSARPPQIAVFEKDLRNMDRGQPELRSEICCNPDLLADFRFSE